jgi:hypothetical protein
MATTPNINLPLIDGSATANVPRDVNALAQAVDTAISGINVTPADGSITPAKLSFDPATQAELDALAGVGLTKTVKQIDDASTAHLADYVRQPGYAVTASVANAYTVATTPAPGAYVDGMGIVIYVHAANTGASTVKWGALAVVPIVDGKGNALTAGKLPLGGRISLRYSSVAGNFQLQGEGGEYGDATADKVLAPNTIGTPAGVIPGTMVDKGVITLTPGAADVAISAGFVATGSKVAAVVNLLAANILATKMVGGVAGTATSDADAVSADIKSGKKAYVNGALVTGSNVSGSPIVTGTAAQDAVLQTFIRGDSSGNSMANIIVGGLSLSAMPKKIIVKRLGTKGTGTASYTVYDVDKVSSFYTNDSTIMVASLGSNGANNVDHFILDGIKAYITTNGFRLPIVSMGTGLIFTYEIYM